mmetsp:Transcript_3471/g.6519  ORF Transcript_3471/g.6519 Transcript_3471/m.6519 type:complete len:214 (+) Transcript_3471:449-1090(+)
MKKPLSLLRICFVRYQPKEEMARRATRPIGASFRDTFPCKIRRSVSSSGPFCFHEHQQNTASSRIIPDFAALLPSQSTTQPIQRIVLPSLLLRQNIIRLAPILPRRGRNSPHDRPFRTGSRPEEMFPPRHGHQLPLKPPVAQGNVAASEADVFDGVEDGRSRREHVVGGDDEAGSIHSRDAVNDAFSSLSSVSFVGLDGCLDEVAGFLPVLLQ